MPAIAWETIYMCLFIFVASYFLHKQAQKNDDTVDYHSDTQAHSKPANLFMKKWLDFGGGYYGIVAFVKLLLIEFQQLKDFAIQWFEKGVLPLDIGSHLIAEFFVQQIQAFVAAIIWPTDYLSNYSIFICAIFVGATYTAYYWAAKAAEKKALQP